MTHNWSEIEALVEISPGEIPRPRVGRAITWARSGTAQHNFQVPNPKLLGDSPQPQTVSAAVRSELDSEPRFSAAMAAPARRSLLVLLAGLLVFASLATLATAIYEDQVGLADWYVNSLLDPIRPKLRPARRKGTSSC